MFVSWHSWKTAKSVHSNFLYECVDGQHFVEVWRRFAEAKKTDPLWHRKQERAREMQAHHIARLFLATDSHGEYFLRAPPRITTGNVFVLWMGCAALSIKSFLLYIRTKRIFDFRRFGTLPCSLCSVFVAFPQAQREGHRLERED